MRARVEALSVEIGLLVYDAAFAPIGPFADADADDLARAVAVNVRSPLLLTKALTAPMIERGRGGVVLMSSLAGGQGGPHLATYAATKAFTTVLAEGLWWELRPRGVDVLVCSAGAIATPGYQAASGAKPAPGTLPPEAVAEAALKALGRRPVVIPGGDEQGRPVRHDAAAQPPRRDRPHGEEHRGAVLRVLLGLATPLIAYVAITLLHVAIPARRTRGYVASEATGEVMRYRLNGRLVLTASIVAWFLLGYAGVVDYTWLYETRWLGLLGACLIGLAYSFWVVLHYPPTGRSFLADFWFGRAQDPQLRDGFIDAKVWFYLVGAVMLQLNVLSFAAYHLANVPAVNPGFLLACGMLTWFCFDYLIFEKVHLWTYDFIAERVGFKLGFGCLAFYPYFYSVSLWFTADRANPGLPGWLTVAFGALFLCGWVLTRGANLQKYLFKTAPERRFLGIAPRVLTDGTQHPARERLLGRQPPRQLPGRDHAGGGRRARHRVLRGLDGVALPGVLRRADDQPPGRRRQGLPREVRRALGSVHGEGAVPDRAAGVLGSASARTRARTSRRRV